MVGFRALAYTLVSLITLALASPATAGINRREERQRNRIGEGARSGELTRREAAALTKEQAAIRREERRYRRNDGHLGPRERADLERDLNRANRHIYRQKHDGQER